MTNLTQGKQARFPLVLNKLSSVSFNVSAVYSYLVQVGKREWPICILLPIHLPSKQELNAKY